MSGENKPTLRLQAAAEAHGDAKLAMERWEGPSTGPEWSRVVADYRKAMIEFHRAGCAYATSTRPHRKAENEEEAA